MNHQLYISAVKKIVENVKDGLSKTLHIGPIKLWAKVMHLVFQELLFYSPDLV